MKSCNVCTGLNLVTAEACGVCMAPFVLASVATPQQELFSEASATNTYPECVEPSHVAAHAEFVESLINTDIAAQVLQKACDTFNAAVAHDVVQSALIWDEPTDWFDGGIHPHYTGWYDVQMMSRLHEVATPAPGITRFWYAGRDWYTGPRGMELGAPHVPRGKIYAWRGRAKP